MSASAVDLTPDVSKLIKAGSKDLVALTNLDGDLDISDALKLHFSMVDPLPVNECLRAWLGDAVVRHLAPGPLLISAERDAVGGGVGEKKSVFRDFEMADLGTAKELIAMMANRDTNHLMNESTAEGVAAGSFYGRHD